MKKKAVLLILILFAALYFIYWAVHPAADVVADGERVPALAEEEYPRVFTRDEVETPAQEEQEDEENYDTEKELNNGKNE